MVGVTVLMKETSGSPYSFFKRQIGTVHSQDRMKLNEYTIFTRQNEAALGHYTHKTQQSFFAAAGPLPYCHPYHYHL